MRRETLATLTIGGAALAAALAGLWLIGGPGSGRTEHRDRVRMDDLRDLGAFVSCVADLEDGTLPAVLAPEPACGDTVDFADPYTGEAYGYLVDFQSDVRGRYRLCAHFEAPERLADGYVPAGSFGRGTGCAVFTYEP